MMHTYKTDWLGLPITFYNDKLLLISSNIHDVIDYSNIEFHPEGLKNYLEFGYSVFGQTPVKNVKFLLPNQKLEILKNKLIITNQHDFIFDYLQEVETKEINVLDLIKSKINKWESKVKGEIVIPTSGGFDSRLLNIMVSGKSRIRSFTYGVSDDQHKSYEVVYAQKLSNILKTAWKQIELGDFHLYLDNWDKLYGVSSHAHGMYQMEFYDQVSNIIRGEKNLLSGIIGDGWSGNVVIPEIMSVDDILKVGYTHGLNADPDKLLLSSGNDLKLEYFLKRKKYFKNEKYRIVESMRMKMLLLSYLLKIPESYGFKVYAPFLDNQIVAAILNLPSKRRLDRFWQKEYFRKLQVNFEEQNIKVDYSNTLDLQGIINKPLPQLNIKILSQIIDKRYLENINSVIKYAPYSLRIKRNFNRFLTLVGTGIIPKYFGINLYNMNCYEAKIYNAYMTIKPLENLLLRSKYEI